MFTLFTVAADHKIIIMSNKLFQFGFSSDKKDDSGSNNKEKERKSPRSCNEDYNAQRALELAWGTKSQTLTINSTQTVFKTCACLLFVAQ